MIPTPDVRWVATLSDGTTAVEHAGQYAVIPGERKPWVRLTQDLAYSDLHLTSLRLNFRGRTIHMPRANFDRFSLNDKSRAPLFYSLQHFLEGEMDGSGGGLIERHFIDLIAHYQSYEVHFIQDLQDGNTSWVLVTEGLIPMARTPLRNEVTLTDGEQLSD